MSLILIAALLAVSTSCWSLINKIPNDRGPLFFDGDKELKDLFEARKPSKMQYFKKPLIPKIIHQIWLGTAPLPKLYAAYMNTWKKYHPLWQYKLWTDEDVKNWQGTFYLKDLYEKTYVVHEKADILRLNIMYRYGGLYADTDIECLKSFDNLNHLYKFYAGSEIRFSLFASSPRNELFQKVFKLIRFGWLNAEKEFTQSNTPFNPFDLIHLAANRYQSPYQAEVKKYIKREPKSILIPNIALIHNVKWPTCFCATRKLLKHFPALQNLNDYTFIVANTMASERVGEVRAITFYNDATKKIKIKPISGYKNFVNWIQNNIDTHFIGCD